MRDILDLKSPVLGFMVRDDDAGEQTAVLYDEGKRFELSVLGHDSDEVTRQFVAAINGESDGSDTEENCEKCIEFRTVDYSYTLIDLEHGPSKASMSSGVSASTIIPKYVVAGVARNDLDTIDGMLSSIDGLSQWLGLSLFQYQQEDLKQSFTTEDTPETEMGTLLGLSFGQKWFFRSYPNSVVATNSVYIQTLLPSTSWSEHMHVHNLILGLMSVADCCPHVYRDLKVYKVHPDANPSTKIEWNEWHDALSYDPVINRTAQDQETSFLFTYQDLSSESITKWNELCNECSQGMVVLLYLIREFDNLALETEVILMGAVFECIGWYIITSNDDTKRMKKRKDKATGKKRLAPPEFEALLDVLLESFVDDIPLTDSLEWKDRMRRAYMGNKHPDAGKATLEEMNLALMEAMVYVRMWIGSQMGADLNTMKNRLRSDRIGQRIKTYIA